MNGTKEAVARYGPPVVEPVRYPESDGKPMAESDSHYANLVSVRFALERFLASRRIKAYVGANLLLYYEEGDPSRSLAPDVFVAIGLEPGRRDIYKVWAEGKVPDVVFEFTSKSTRSEDLGTKKGLYGYLGVKEYFLFDPRQEYLEPRLRGYRLEGEEMLPVTGPTMTSKVLGLELCPVGELLRLRIPGEKGFLPTPEEEAEVRRAAEERAAAEAEARRAAEERAAAEAEARRAAEERAAAEAEARRALEAELRRLQAIVGQQGKAGSGGGGGG